MLKSWTCTNIGALKKCEIRFWNINGDTHIRLEDGGKLFELVELFIDEYSYCILREMNIHI